ncbi:MAG: type II toxin-antitoxin system HicA family toxin [Clostridia bacterium]|nr:type II toxin-antitoxin system HicA family toxin [Clostridia bacterium]
MSQKEKLIKRVRSNPKDFTFRELEVLMRELGFQRTDSGKTSGSAVKFSNGEKALFLHRPHPRNVLKPYQVKDLINLLNELEGKGKQ